MIQRKQTIWLLLAAIAAFLTLRFSFYSGNMVADNQTKKFESLTATGNILILIITVAIGIASLITIFLYKNRKLQLRITIAATLVSIMNILLYYNQSKKFTEGNFDLTALITIAIPILLFFAARGISKDEKLVKSVDRLR